MVKGNAKGQAIISGLLCFETSKRMFSHRRGGQQETILDGLDN